MNSDRTNQQQIYSSFATSAWSNWSPVYSPDGKRIVFVSQTDGNSELYLMNHEGKEVTRLTRNSAEDLAPHWSPDGRRIIFSSNRNGKFALYEIQLL